MFGQGALSFREFAMKEPLPLATVHDAVLEFLRHREDAVLFGAQAVNAYVDEPRMTQDVDVLSTRAADLAEELRAMLNERFHVAVRVWEVREGLCYRVYQVRKPDNRHLVDVRQVDELPSAQQIADVQVIEPAELVISKLNAWVSRRGKPKAGTDWRDLALLLLTFPDLRLRDGTIDQRLQQSGADAGVLQAWEELREADLAPDDDE